MTMLPMYRISKIPPIYIGNICSYKCCVVALHGAFGNPSWYFVSDEPSRIQTVVQQSWQNTLWRNIHS